MSSLYHTRADSPVLGFNADSKDPLHFPSPDYTRDLPLELNDALDKPSTYYSFLSNFPNPPHPSPSNHPLHNEPQPLPNPVIPALHKRANPSTTRKQPPSYIPRQSSLSQYSIPPLPQQPPPPAPDTVRNAVYINTQDMGDRLGTLLSSSSPSTSPSSRFPERIPEDPIAEHHFDQLEMKKPGREGDPLYMTPVSTRTLRSSRSQVFIGSASRRDAETRSRAQVYFNVPSIRPPLPHPQNGINKPYLNMPPSPSSLSRSSDDSSGSTVFTSPPPKRKFYSATEGSADADMVTPGTSPPTSVSFDIPSRPLEPRAYSYKEGILAKRSSFEKRIPSNRSSLDHVIPSRASFEHPVTSRTSFDSMAEKRPVVVVHRYADGHERVYRYSPNPADADGYDAEYEYEALRSPQSASRSLGSPIESVNTTKLVSDDGHGKKEKDKGDKPKGDKDKEDKDKDKDKEKEKMGKKKKRLASLMSRLNLGPSHPYAPVMLVPGRWEDVEFVAPSPSRSRGRAIPLSVRAEMMREKERKREREKQRLKELESERALQRERELEGGDVRDHVDVATWTSPGPGITGNQNRGNGEHDSHIRAHQQQYQYDPHMVEEENLNQDPDLGYAPSMSFSHSSSQSHVVQTFEEVSTTGLGEGVTWGTSERDGDEERGRSRMRSRMRANSTPLPFVGGAGEGEEVDEPIVYHPVTRTTRLQPAKRARADSESAGSTSYSTNNIDPYTANTNANAYADVSADADAQSLPYRLSLSLSLPLLPLHFVHDQYATHTNTSSTTPTPTTPEQTRPPPRPATSPSTSTSFNTTTRPPPSLSSFKDYSSSSGHNSHSNSPSTSSSILGSGAKGTSRRSLGIRSLAARMIGAHHSPSNSDSTSTSTSASASTSTYNSSPEQSRSNSPVVQVRQPYVSEATRVNREYEFGYAWTPFRGGSSLEKAKGEQGEKEKKKKKEKEKKILVISGIGNEEEDAVRKWCEAFGEVKAFERRGQGCLVVNFRKASVADTVCRVQAQVHIRGAESAKLNWYTKSMLKNGEVVL